jgi:hypothetical protein
MDPANGAFYLKADFEAFYGSSKEWEAAGLAATFPEIQLDVTAIRSELTSGLEQSPEDEVVCEDGYEVEEETLVLSQEWADRFARNEVSKDSGKSKKRSKDKRGRKTKPPENSLKVPLVVVERRDVSYGSGEATVRALEEIVRELVQTSWPVYPEVALNGVASLSEETTW